MQPIVEGKQEEDQDVRLLTAALKALDQKARILDVKLGSRLNNASTVAIILEALKKTATTDGANGCLRLNALSGPLSALVKNVRWSWRRTGTESDIYR